MSTVWNKINYQFNVMLRSRNVVSLWSLDKFNKVNIDLSYQNVVLIIILLLRTKSL